jgi:membrane protease YdiL (CAAX protease family)
VLLGWLLAGNLVSAFAWRRRMPINTGPAYALQAAGMYLFSWPWARREWARPDGALRVRPQALAVSAFAGLMLSAPALLAFRFSPVRERLRYAPLEELSRRALLRRVLWEIPILTALSEELLFRGYFDARQGPAPFLRRMAVNASLFTAWHFVVALRTVLDTSVRGNPVAVVASYVGSLLSVAAGGAVFCLIRERTRSVVCSAAAHWAVDAALTIGFWLGRSSPIAPSASSG